VELLHLRDISQELLTGAVCLSRCRFLGFSFWQAREPRAPIRRPRISNMQSADYVESVRPLCPARIIASRRNHPVALGIH